jgi:hypothetical protein
MTFRRMPRQARKKDYDAARSFVDKIVAPVASLSSLFANGGAAI